MQMTILKSMFYLILTVSIHSCSLDDGYRENPNQQKSLTDSSYQGKKLFYAWSANYLSDPDSLKLEVNSDVQHMHHIFSRSWGGGYSAKMLLGDTVSRKDAILDLIIDAKNQLGENDNMQQLILTGLALKE